jgi:hypothetical protein
MNHALCQDDLLFVTWIGENGGTPALFARRLPGYYGSVIEQSAAWEIACEAGAAALSYAPMRRGMPPGRFLRAEHRERSG